MSRRRSVDIHGFKHVNPIPNASRIGNLLISGLIIGVDPETGQLPDSVVKQCANMFAHMRSIVEAGGLSMDDVIKMNVWLRDPSDRSALNDEWTKAFPDAGSRPARQALPLTGAGDALIQCEIIAVAG